MRYAELCLCSYSCFSRVLAGTIRQNVADLVSWTEAQTTPGLRRDRLLDRLEANQLTFMDTLRWMQESMYWQGNCIVLMATKALVDLVPAGPRPELEGFLHVPTPVKKGADVAPATCPLRSGKHKVDVPVKTAAELRTLHDVLANTNLWQQMTRWLDVKCSLEPNLKRRSRMMMEELISKTLGATMCWKGSHPGDTRTEGQVKPGFHQFDPQRRIRGLVIGTFTLSYTHAA